MKRELYVKVFLSVATFIYISVWVTDFVVSQSCPECIHATATYVANSSCQSCAANFSPGAQGACCRDNGNWPCPSSWTSFATVQYFVCSGTLSQNDCNNVCPTNCGGWEDVNLGSIKCNCTTQIITMQAPRCI